MLSKNYRNSVRWAFNIQEWKPTSNEWTLATQCVQTEETERIHRFVFAEDAKASMVGQLLMRKAASEITGIPYNEVKFSRSETGKPFVSSHSEILRTMNYNFNISHHGSMCVLAAGLGRRLGIDVMNVELRDSRSVPEYFNLMQKQFSSAEWNFIMCPSSENEQLQRFFRLWCLKESYVKGKGTGISYNLRNLSFDCKTARLKECVIVTDTKLFVQESLESNWLFEETMLNKNHCVAVAVEKGLQGSRQHDNDDIQDESNFSILNYEELMLNACPFVAPHHDFWKMFCGKSARPQ